MREIVTRMTLGATGATLSVIGCALLLIPKTFLEKSHVVFERNASLMSELAAPSGVLIIAGGLMMLGSVKPRFIDIGLVVGAIIYGSYGVGRIISMLMHGLPSSSLVSATLFELVIAGMLIALRIAQAPASTSTVMQIKETRS
ncbi:MAG: DUF4345 domain-containing protein [Pseudomonadota bacterium]